MAPEPGAEWESDAEERLAHAEHGLEESMHLLAETLRPQIAASA